MKPNGKKPNQNGRAALTPRRASCMAVPDIRLDEKRRLVKDKPCLGKMALRDGQKLIERSDNAGSIAPFSRFFLFFQMILFLQGASHAGKTTFAKHLARLTGASVVSLDLLKMGLIKSGNTNFPVSHPRTTRRLPSASGPLCARWHVSPMKTVSR